MTATTQATVPGAVDPAALPLFLPARTPTPSAQIAAAVSSPAGRTAPEAVLAGGVDWVLVQTVRAQVADQLAKEGRSGFGEEERELGRALIVGVVAAETRARQQRGEPWSRESEAAHAKAVFDALFGMGRFQPLLDDDSVENVIVVGCDTVFLEHMDGSVTRGEPVADSDAELIGWLDFIASRSEANARSFSPSRPHLHVRLDDGSRLAAAAWVTPRPSVVIRRHRLQRVSLEELVERGTLPAVAASFLAAAVRAGLSVVVSGPQGGGKTTLLRALCAQIPAAEMIGTFETEYELHLHQMPDRHPVVHAWEARPGSGEIGPDGRQAGEITLAECLQNSFRFNLSRLIVGEIRGPEVWVMIKAMESARGSLSTTHSATAVGAVEKLISCAMEIGPAVTREVAARKLAAAVDIVVQMRMDTTPGQRPGESRRERWVSEIVHVMPGEDASGYATNTIFTTDPGSRRARPAVLTDALQQLSRYGFDLAGYQRERGA